MNNFYYYLFYCVAVFARKVNKKDSEYAFSSQMFLTLCMSLNLLSILFIVIKVISVKVNLTLYMIVILVITFTLNYFLIRRHQTYLKVISYFDNKYAGKKHKFCNVFFVIAYIVFSYCLAIYSGSLVRELYLKK